MKNILLIIVFLLFCIVGSTQPYNLQIKITNQSKNNIVLGKVRGDRFIFLDSLNSEGFTSDETLTKIFKYKFPENSTIGTYRLILGKTRYAEIMNEPPQQIDFIFNNENINFETDFNDPIEKISIIESEENKAWFAFKNKEKMYRQWLTQLRQTINNSQVNESEIQGKKVEYNMAMMERETFIQQSVKEKPHLFVSKIFKMFHEPLTDAYLNKEEGRIAYVNEYFNNLDFNDEELINTTIYTDKVIHYIQSYGQYGLSREQQENEFIKAVDIVIGHVNKNQVVYEFILDYIVRGFENLNLKKALAHIAEVYGETTCQTDEKTTLERRLGAQKMLAGTQVLDFTLNDINGDPITLSEIAKEKTLIVFWASWCPHCNELIPEIKTWEEQLNSEIVEVIAVSIDSIKLDWQNQVFKSGIESWYNLSDLKGWDGKVTEQYNVYATPIMLLIDKNLTILSKPENLFELKTALE